MVGKVAIPQLFEELDCRLRRHLRQSYLTREILGFRIGVADDEGRGRQNKQLVTTTTVTGQPAFDVFVKRLPGAQCAVPGEDRIGRSGREIPSLVRVAGLKNHRSPLWAPRHVEPPVDVEMRVLVTEFARVRS